MGTTKDKCAVFQLAGGTVVELETADAISLLVGGYLMGFDVQLVQSIHGTHPEVAILVFLDTGDVRA